LLVQVELEFLPWMTQQAMDHIQQEAVARAVLQQIVADAVTAQASTPLDTPACKHTMA
jgi:hypothetical protein